MPRSPILPALCLAALLLSPARAAEPSPIRLGFITTLSGAEGVIGVDIRDAFNLALDESDHRWAGRPVEMIVGDDQTKPDIGRQLADKMIESDHVQIMTGIIFSNVLLAAIRPISQAGVFFVSANAGPSQLAGKGCLPNLFVASFQNDTLYESVGTFLDTRKVASAFLLAPNYPGGRDMMSGFKRHYHGEIKGEVYTAFPQMDFAPQIADIREKKPASVLFFLPGSMTIGFVKQYVAAGLSDIPLYNGTGSVTQNLAAMGDAALGITTLTNWTAALDNQASRDFTAAFVKRYGRIPSSYAGVAYDTARLIAAAVGGVHGDIEDKPAFRRALEGVKFDSVRGNFAFNTNHYPIQNMYETVIGHDAQGHLAELYKGVAVRDVHDSFASQCVMPPG